MRRDSFRCFATRIVQRVSVPNWIGITRGGVRWRAGADANPDGVWRLHAARRNWSWRTRRGLSGTPEKPQSDCRVKSHWSRPMVEHAALERFRHEAAAAARLEHAQIVPIYEIGERDGSCYFSMKFVEGGRLDEMAKCEPMSPRRAAELLLKIARTVQFAHEHGILHRDIKPGNILLDKKGEPHLTDFGLARLIEQESTITNSFEVLGTPSYMPPEQAAGHAKELTPAADVYSLGAVFYHMLTAEPPFAGGTTYETIRMVLETEPRNPRTRNPKVDVDLATI